MGQICVKSFKNGPYNFWKTQTLNNKKFSAQNLTLIEHIAWDSQKLKLCHRSLYSGNLKSDHFKSWLFEGRISNRLVFKQSAFSFGKNWTIQNPYAPVQISNGFWQNVRILKSWASRLQIPFKIQTIWNNSKSGLFWKNETYSLRNELW